MMKRLNLTLFPIIFLTQAFYTHALIAGPKESPEISAVAERNKFVVLTVENDSLGSGVDKGYTNGFLLSYFDSGYRPIQFAAWMNQYLPWVPFNDHSKISFSIGHNMYTPEDIRVVENQPHDRPWAGYLYGAMRSYTIFEDFADDLELTLGVVGPSAQGKYIQQNIHETFSARRYPRGWDNQLHDEPALMVSYRRRWLQLFGGDLDPFGLSFAIEPNLGGNLGNIYTSAESGIMLRIMAKTRHWMDTPLLVRPSMPGSSFFYHKNEAFNWQIFAGVQGRAIAHTIFLDGNTFRGSNSVDKRALVADLNVGAAVAYSSLRLSYTLIYRTKEYDGQTKDSMYGNVNIGYSF